MTRQPNDQQTTGGLGEARAEAAIKALDCFASMRAAISIPAFEGGLAGYNHETQFSVSHKAIDDAQAAADGLRALSAGPDWRALCDGLVCQFDHQGCCCTFPSETCCSYAQAFHALAAEPKDPQP